MIALDASENHRKSLGAGCFSNTGSTLHLQTSHVLTFYFSAIQTSIILSTVFLRLRRRSRLLLPGWMYKIKWIERRQTGWEEDLRDALWMVSF